MTPHVYELRTSYLIYSKIQLRTLYIKRLKTKFDVRTMEGLDILEKRNAIRVLIQIFENPGINKSGLIDMEPEGRGSKLERIDELIEADLICTKKTIEKNPIIKRRYKTR